MAIVYAYYIEAPLARRWKAPQVLSYHRGHLAPFVPVHGRFSGLHVARAPRFNLHKTKNILLPADQVNLPSATRRTKISRHHRVAQFPQMEVSRFLALAPHALVSGSIIRGQSVRCQPVQNAKRRLRAPSRKCSSRKHRQAPRVYANGLVSSPRVIDATIPRRKTNPGSAIPRQIIAHVGQHRLVGYRSLRVLRQSPVLSAALEFFTHPADE